MAPRWNRTSGKFPEFGAIFMSNTETRQECLSRSLFALPRTFAEFVRKVRAGMILFLFDHQQKKLFGVFEAVSDGGLNIVPHAFTSSGRSFPAQVPFRIIWKCSPLHQHEFRYVIRDNYYTEDKFNYGLSEDQVQRLLHLFESRVRIQKSPTERKIKHSDHSREKKSADVSCCEPGKLGDFIPSFSAESFGSFSSQSSPDHSKDQDLPYSRLKVKGLYSDHIVERKSAQYTRDETKGTCGHLDINAKAHHYKDSEIERRGSYADVKTMKEIMRNLLRKQESWMKSQTRRSHVSRKRETPGGANTFSCSNFNSKSEEKYKEKEQKRDHDGRDKYYGRGGYGKYYRRGGCDKYYGRAEKRRAEKRPIPNVKPEGKTDRDIRGKRCNYSPVSSCFSDMHQKKRKLAMPIQSADLDNDGVCESYLDDQVQSCENSIVSSKSESFQPSPSNMPFEVDAMKYLENIWEQNQGQEKCDEKDVLLSCWESEMIEIVDNYKRFLEDMATIVSSLVSDDDNSNAKVRNIEDKLENSTNMNSAETPLRPVSPILTDSEVGTMMSDSDHHCRSTIMPVQAKEDQQKFTGEVEHICAMTQ